MNRSCKARERCTLVLENTHCNDMRIRLAHVLNVLDQHSAPINARLITLAMQPRNVARIAVLALGGCIAIHALVCVQNICTRASICNSSLCFYSNRNHNRCYRHTRWMGRCVDLIVYTLNENGSKAWYKARELGRIQGVKPLVQARLQVHCF